MPTKRCRSNCTTNKTPASCNATEKCSYTNGPKRKFCRLSSKYRMNKPDCNITRKFLKREKGPASKIQRFLTRKYKSRKKQILYEEITKGKNINTPTTRVRRSFEKQLKALEKKENQSKIQIEDILPPPPALIKTPNETDLKRITDKAHTRRIQRFMKGVNPNKRRAMFLNGVCSDSGVCIAFGKHTETIKKHFDKFIEFRHVKSLRKIGVVSANGFVKELEYEHMGYKSHAVLKSTIKSDSDNLYYEYLVGLFLNEQSKYSPIFVETYGVFGYLDDKAHAEMKKITATKAELDKLAVLRFPGMSKNYLIDAGMWKKHVIDDNIFGLSCKYSKSFAVLIQHIKDAGTLHEKCINHKFVKIDLVNILFQIYYTLRILNDTFTHNDLHTENVLVYEPVKGGYIQYYYHNTSGTVHAFKSAYIPKIIDYGRCFYDFKRPKTANDVENSSQTVYKAVCDLKKDCTICGIYKGYSWLEPNSNDITSHDPNMSMDLRLLRMLYIGFSDFGGADRYTIRKNIVDHPLLNNLFKKVKYNTMFYTTENKTMGTACANDADKTINNVADAYIMLAELIQHPQTVVANEAYYAGHKKIGEMHVYEDRPLEFVVFTK